jgi:CRISPR-associated protein Cst2
MAEKAAVRSIALSGRIALAMHSLNNEGTEGNQQLTRMINVVRPNGQLESVNGISGDMLKHILAEHLHRIAMARGLNLSEGARRFSANRIMVPEGEFDRWLQSKEGKSADPAAVVDKVLDVCTVTDALGILITAGNKSVPRKSIVEFGWVVGIPDEVRTGSYFHVKYDPARGESRGQEQQTGQAIFHRPASSGRYAVVAMIELDRVGFNDITRKYVPAAADRRERARALLESFVATFVEPAGAQRNTQNPHITAFDGVLALSRGRMPAPCISSLNEKFVDEVEGVAIALNRVAADTIEARRFGSPAEFANVMADVIEGVAVPAGED